MRPHPAVALQWLSSSGSVLCMSRCLGVTSGQCGHSSLSFPPVELVIKCQHCKQLCATWFQRLGAGQLRLSCQQGSRLSPGAGSLLRGHLSQPQVPQGRSTGTSEQCLQAQHPCPRVAIQRWLC